MIYLLVVVAIVEFVYIIYQDLLNRKERDRLQMKLMSKDLPEYKSIVDKPEESKEEPPSSHVPIEEVDIDKLLQAEDNL